MITAPLRTIMRSTGSLARITRIDRRHLSATRSILQDVKTPSEKITVVPFMLDPTSAQQKMKENALLSTITIPNAIYAFALRWFGESVTPFLHEFGLGGNGLKHERTKAVYWPIWRFTLLADIDIPGTTKSPSLIMFNSTGLSGNSFSPVSLLDFTQPELPDDLLPWDAEQDLKQLESVGVDVDAVPFSVDPLKVMQGLKRKVGRHVRLGDMKVDLERDVNEILFAAYPIYFPLYVSEWSFKLNDDSKERRISIVMNADDADPRECRCVKPMIPGLGEKTRNFGYWMEMPHIIPDPDSPHPEPKGDIHRTVAQSYVDWLNPATRRNTLVGEQDPRSGSLVAPTSPLEQLDVEESEIAWNDPRVQSWSGEERKENTNWMMAQAARVMMEGQLQKMQRAEKKADNKPVTTLRIDMQKRDDGSRGMPSFSKVTMEEAIAAARKSVEEAKRDVESQKPQWLKARETKEK
ncbi:hypothetical protein FFLO_02507 [Filobasidium floriforme]|uniref:Uncharacterized protein n=1 Tax=Filobasidium floriforme TaxID=5210 RepID=A0A8K0JMG2_9TREE|nr:hypothetical protein FFLO_02507 [Filobasidium floriforme]